MTDKSTTNAPTIPIKLSGVDEGALRWSVGKSFDTITVMRAEWDRCIVSQKSSVYMSYDWCKTWWHFYGAGKDLRIFIFQAGDEIVGLIPLYIETLGAWPFRFRVARILGANHPPKVFNPPVSDVWSKQAFDIIINVILKEDSCDLLSFGPVASHYSALHGLQESCRDGNDIVHTLEVKKVGVHTVFHLPETYEDFLQAMSKNEKKNRRKYELRYLQNRFRTAVDILSGNMLPEKDYPIFVKMHTEQWNSEGRPGHFRAWPHAERFNAALVDAFSQSGAMRLMRITADGAPISYEYAFECGDAYYWELPARVVGRDWEQFSLGRTSLCTLIKCAIDEGKKRVEGGLGHYEYKLKLGAKEYPVFMARIVSGRLMSRVNYMFFSALSFLVTTVYHKIWYRRIQPRFPSLLKRPLWAGWIKLSF